MEINITDTAHGRTRLKISGASTLEQACTAFKAKRNFQDWDEVTLKRAAGHSKSRKTKKIGHPEKSFHHMLGEEKKFGTNFRQHTPFHISLNSCSPTVQGKFRGLLEHLHQGISQLFV
jgi:hypothetical protein